LGEEIDYMKPTPAPSWNIAQRNLKLSPYLTIIGIAVAAVLAVWAPFHLLFLCLAAGVGAIAFALQWLGVRRRSPLGPLSTWMGVTALMAASHWLLPRDTPDGSLALSLAQFVAVWMFSFAVLHIVFWTKLSADLEVYGAQHQD
jgi:hypothetical protein